MQAPTTQIEYSPQEEEVLVISKLNYLIKNIEDCSKGEIKEHLSDVKRILNHTYY